VLSPLELVPVLGYVIQRGRCRACGAAIPFAYPVVEAVAALVLAVGAAWLGLWAIGIAVAVTVAIVGFSAGRRPRRAVPSAGNAPGTDSEIETSSR
jgi:prepilin signal peptidase PulO-like enzyme (type II secretory pathway)